MRLRCYVNPVSFELANEVDPAIASTLFHRIGGEMIPRPILNHCRFVSNVGPHSFEYCRDPRHSPDRVLIQNVDISKLEAGKVTPESNDWALMFTVSFEKNDPKVMNDLSDLLHEHFYCTFAELQPSLFPEKDEYDSLLCRLCDAPNPEFIVIGSKPPLAYCAKHEHQKEQGEKTKRIRDTAAAEDAVRSLREPGDESENEKPKGKDPLANDLNRRNQMGRRKRK